MRPEYALVVAPFAGTVAAALVILVEPKSPFGIATLVAGAVSAVVFNALFFRRVVKMRLDLH